jgi:hypothetical protein
MQLYAGCQRAAIVVVFLVGSASVAVAQETPRIPHVRSYDPLIAEAIAHGTQRSAAFRTLIEAIDETDGLVYVERGNCGSGVRACLRLSVQLSGPYRVLRILVNPDRARGCELTSSIGHELHHALEALRHRQVRSDVAIVNLYDRIGISSHFGRFETNEAWRTESKVRTEACGNQR